MDQLAALLRDNPGLLDQLKSTQPQQQQQQQSKPGLNPATLQQDIKNSMTKEFEKKSSGYREKDRPEIQGQQQQENDSTPKEPNVVDDEEEEEAPEPMKDQASLSPQTDSDEKKKTEDNEDYDVVPKKDLENMNRMRTEMEKKQKELNLEMEKLRKQLEEKDADSAKVMEALTLIAKTNDAEEVIRRETQKKHERIRKKQGEMLKTIKLAQKLRNDLLGGKKESEVDSTTADTVGALEQAIAKMHEAAQEKNFDNAEKMLDSVAGTTAIATAAARSLARERGRLTDMEKKHQQEKQNSDSFKKPPARQQQQKRLSPTDLAEEMSGTSRGKKRPHGKEPEQEGEGSSDVQELEAFASRTFKVWDDDQPLSSKRRRRSNKKGPFSRRDFGDYTPFGEHMEREYAYQAKDAFGWKARGEPNTRDCIHYLYEGKSYVKTYEDENELEKKYPIIPNPMYGRPLTQEQAKKYGIYAH